MRVVLFPQATSDIARENGSKLCQGRLISNIGKKMFTERVNWREALEQVAQRNGGITIPGVLKK